MTSRGASVFSPNGPSMWPSEPLTVDKIQEKMMVNALTQCGYDKAILRSRQHDVQMREFRKTPYAP